MGKEMATHSSVLAWRIPGTAETSGLLSMGCHRVGHDWSDLAALLLLLLSCSVVSNSATAWTRACQSPLSFTVSWSLHKFMYIESVMLSNHLILCHPLLLLPSIFGDLPESNSSNQGFNLKRWMVSGREMRQPLSFLLDCLFISSVRFSFILLQKH